VWALALIALAQSPVVTISGQIYAEGQAVPNHSVWLISRVGDPTQRIIAQVMRDAEGFDPAALFPTATVLKQTTDEAGQFTFAALPYDSYWLVTLAPQGGLNPFVIHHVSMTALIDNPRYDKTLTFAAR
jgi:hypothetical protein